MDSKTTRPSGWYYGLAALMPVLGCLIAMVMTYQWFPGLPGAWQAEMSLENLTPVVVPGSQDITFRASTPSPAGTQTAGHNRRSYWPSDRTLCGSSLVSRQEPSLRLRLAWPCCLAQALSRLSL